MTKVDFKAEKARQGKAMISQSPHHKSSVKVLKPYKEGGHASNPTSFQNSRQTSNSQIDQQVKDHHP